MEAFAEVMKVTNHTALWDDKLAWYSLCATRWIGPCDLEHGIWIDGFSPTRQYLIFEVLNAWIKFLQTSGYCTVFRGTSGSVMVNKLD